MARPVDAVISGAREFLGERVTTNAALREQHSHGEDAQPRIRENVLGLTVALADGRLIRTGGRVRKSAAGYDLTHLMDGTLRQPPRLGACQEPGELRPPGAAADAGPRGSGAAGGVMWPDDIRSR